MSTALKNNDDFNDPEQGVWQIIPVEGKKNVFYLKNNLYEEYLVPKFTEKYKNRRNPNR